MVIDENLTTYHVDKEPITLGTFLPPDGSSLPVLDIRLHDIPFTKVLLDYFEDLAILIVINLIKDGHGLFNLDINLLHLFLIIDLVLSFLHEYAIQ